jgi:hypothetical protein
MFWLYCCYYAITSILFLFCIHFISGILQHFMVVLHRALECSGALYTKALPLFCEKSSRFSFSAFNFFFFHLLRVSYSQYILVLASTPCFLRIDPLLFGNLTFSFLALKSLFVFSDLELTCCFLLIYLTKWKLL